MVKALIHIKHNLIYHILNPKSLFCSNPLKKEKIGQSVKRNNIHCKKRYASDLVQNSDDFPELQIQWQKLKIKIGAKILTVICFNPPKITRSNTYPALQVYDVQNRKMFFV